MIYVDTSEVADLTADLAAAGIEAKAVATVAVAESGSALRNDAQAAAPRATGALAASIYVRRSADGVTVGSDLPQGFFQEYGTSRHPPQPWLFPNSDRAGARIATALERIDPL